MMLILRGMILNSMGQPIETYRMNSADGRLELRLSAYEEGLYFIRIITGEGTGVAQLIIE